MKISVIVTSYNHAKYIAQCMDSILCQKGEFEMEVLLGDDCSTDNTPEILQEYQQKYPQIIRFLPREKNLGITKNLKRCLDACTGDFIAICEGDDYWTHPNKLQKQMDFLLRHPDYSMCFSALTLYFEDTGKSVPFFDQLKVSRDELTTEDLIEQNFIGNFSCCMYRTNVVRQLSPAMFDFFTVDWMFNIACSEMGKIGFMRESLSVYRKHTQGAWTGKSDIDQVRELIVLVKIYDKFLNYRYTEKFGGFLAVLEDWLAARVGPEKPAGESSNQVNQPVLSWKTSGIRKFKNTFRPFWHKVIRARNFILDFYRYYLWLFKEKLKFYSKRLVDQVHLWANEDSFRGKAARLIAKQKPDLPPPMGVQDQAVKEAEPLTSNIDEPDLLILDTVFPHPLSPFRLHEFKHYLEAFPNARVLTNAVHIHLLADKRSPEEIIQEFEQQYPHLRGRTIYQPNPGTEVNGKLAYLTFLNNIKIFIHLLEEKQIPFVFTLYPGGGFEMNQPNTDRVLRRVFSSPMFRKVIVTQNISRDYLLSKGFCEDEKIEFIYGVVSSINENELLKQKRHFSFGKDTLDICFVAYKYTERGVDKGYDVFIETAKRLANLHDNIRFHVVGNFGWDDIPLDGLEGKITFYGVHKQDWFVDFYYDKDIIISPNIPFVLQKGAFDGFPTASCTDAALQEVAMFCTDDLSQNIMFVDREDIVLISHDCDEIISVVEHYYTHPEALAILAKNGATKVRNIYSDENQLLPRKKLLEQELLREVVSRS